MGIITARGKLILTGESGVTNPSNITDDNNTTYGTITKPSNNTLDDIVVGGFDFSKIPNGSIINSFSLKSYCGLDSGVTCSLYATRKYIKGAWKDSAGNSYGGVGYDAAFGSGGTLAVNEIAENAPFKIFEGFSTEDINRSWSNASDYTGIGFYIRYRGLSSTSKKAYPRYFDLTVDFTPPSNDGAYRGTKKQSVYRGTKKQSVYRGTKKIT